MLISFEKPNFMIALLKLNLQTLMKTKSIKVVVIEQQHYYSQLIGEEINELRNNKSLTNFKFEIESKSNVESVLGASKNNFQVVVFDNHFSNVHQRSDYDVMKTIDAIKSNNKNCFFISVSGYREINILGHLYKNGELTFVYSKQCKIRNENLDDSISKPSFYKLMERYIEGVLKEIQQTKHLLAA